ncbi:hypothetical protein [Nitrosomonas sp.]|uniref:hypothetical protein n=1 Tax=Nitrosomonas sp. TaxID=42353 RepID=UPI00284E800D|nr:hypothetical protein [Nitrosomonas sp.]MDR4513375.1 hypothetical protein [Nitrosomonas sp.]
MNWQHCHAGSISVYRVAATSSFTTPRNRRCIWRQPIAAASRSCVSAPSISAAALTPVAWSCAFWVQAAVAATLPARQNRTALPS